MTRLTTRRGECTIVSSLDRIGKKLVGFRVSADIYRRIAGACMLCDICIIQKKKGSRIRKERYNAKHIGHAEIKDVVYDDYEID